MPKSPKELWNKHGFEILLGISIFIILILALTRIGKKGTWNTEYIYWDAKKMREGKRLSNEIVVRKPTDSKGERECRRVLEHVFNRSFDKDRPDFLRNPVTGGSRNLELDCFNRQLGLAVEYNGIQHYKYTPYFHKNKEAFRNQGYRDFMKRKLCKENDIDLIEVPYIVKISDIEGYLVDKLRNKGYL